LTRLAVAILALALLAAPLVAGAQPGSKVYRVALIFTTSSVAEMAGSEPIHPLARAFVHGLREDARADDPAVGVPESGRGDPMNPVDLRRRLRILPLMLTTLSWRYPAGAEPELIAGLRTWLGALVGRGGTRGARDLCAMVVRGRDS
jgi:hypothetical protein